MRGGHSKSPGHGPSGRGDPPHGPHPEGDSPGALYAVLGLEPSAGDTEIRRRYRTVLTQAHPDKGGSPEHFRSIQAAYAVLCDPARRKVYDATGQVPRSPDAEFLQAFAGGAFADPLGPGPGPGGPGAGPGPGYAPSSLAEALTVAQRAGEAPSHAAGFEAWMRSRADAGGRVFTADTVADTYGVVRQSYDAVPLPRADVLQVLCIGPGPNPADTLRLSSAPLPAELAWGEVLVAMRYAAVSAADLYSARLGGVYGSDVAPRGLPYVAGHDGVGVVAKVGPGVRALREGDWVLPARPFAGTWAAAGVWPEKGLTRLAQGGLGPSLPPAYGAMWRELALGHLLLEGAGLKPGDAVILNAASSTVGQVVLQLCKLLRLRAVAVIRPPDGRTPAAADAHGAPEESSARTVAEQSPEPSSAGAAAAQWGRSVAWLKGLGAAEVLADRGSLKTELERLRFFARPRLALDAVGGDSAARLVDALGEGGELVVYGCMGGRAPALGWRDWVFRDVRARGLNLRRWVAAQPSRLPEVLSSLARLVDAGLLKVSYTEYELSEFAEALSHALEPGRQTKVVLRMAEPRGGLGVGAGEGVGVGAEEGLGAEDGVGAAEGREAGATGKGAKGAGKGFGEGGMHRPPLATVHASSDG